MCQHKSFTLYFLITNNTISVKSMQKGILYKKVKNGIVACDISVIQHLHFKLVGKIRTEMS